MWWPFLFDSTLSIEQGGTLLMVLVLSLVLGYYAVFRTPAPLHAPLMSLTNGVSSVVVVMALDSLLRSWDAWSALVLFILFINIAGGLFMTQRMLAFFSKKP
ncbi:MAG: hypothetical protein BGO07_02000 [Alphaproteobacteria bacterium 40-19]|mgnify:CR=1 FL=1|jgi:NAD(P) transhydrogenase subunit alpha|nr:MAG: hypothetical protein BGO07_02000 [Alphaproteobacteria bacterium 40-19]